MKKIFTLAAAALALTATAAPKMPMEKAELTPEAQQRMATHMAAFQNNALETIDGEIVAKRSYFVGNWQYDLLVVTMGDLVDNVTFGSGYKPTFDDIPLYGVEYFLSGVNTATAKETSLALLLGWPSKYWGQLMTWEGPWEEIPNEEDPSDPDYDIPVAMRDYEIVPIADLCEGQPLGAMFMCTGYASPLTVVKDTALPEQWAGPYCWPALPFGGLKVDNVPIEADYEWSFENQNGESCIVSFEDYSYDPDYMEDYFLTASHWYYSQENTMKTFDLNYDGTGAAFGWDDRTYDVNLSEVYIYNAGTLNEDNNNFYEFTDNGEDLQMWRVMFCNEEIQIGYRTTDQAAIEADPTYTNCFEENAYMRYFPASENANLDNAFFGRATLFSPAGTAKPENTQWNLKQAEDKEFTILGKPTTVHDYLVPEANMFVQYGIRSAGNEYSSWASEYGTWTNLHNSMMIAADKDGVIAMNTPEGMLIRYTNDTRVTLNMTYNGKIAFCPNNQNILQVEEMVSTGTFEPEVGVAELFGTKGGVKVGARNGMISIDSMEAGNVAVYTMDGALVNATRTNGNSTVNIPAAKGMYIVKVGNETRKVVL